MEITDFAEALLPPHGKESLSDLEETAVAVTLEAERLKEWGVKTGDELIDFIGEGVGDKTARGVRIMAAMWAEFVSK